MVRTMYLTAWTLVATAACLSAFDGDAYPSPMVFLTLVILGLLYALVLYSLLVNPRMSHEKHVKNE